ncbi:UDP-N-acetylenolpyruvoylglucosamine reductase [Pseudoalteromonas holothuriae]|uniref:UDP-N-acetylenolpyruvoylglucosamine reductase n=1 Tax=Pseudoalteromonas holothuriae TaxID=2963714 RepID=A0ABM9GMD1_9GAMM|nr:UDP-N-acetylmuramate dehydrogenase [Pseudoalteromonas sp. CIP111951]CAH9065690.1 UDP-N-acetylenolpyruvoylglucosamine reductase [Pseudoalteromonas sp. CIP111951]
MHALRPLHTFALPSRCHQLITLTHWQQLLEIDFTKPFCLLGQGSNTIFVDDFEGSVLHVALKGIEINEHQSYWQVKVAAGESWHDLVIELLDKGIAGLENLALIPGTVGAAPVQNIGAYGVELAQFVDHIEGFDIQTQQLMTLSAEQCQFGYRDSIFKHALKARFVITQVCLRLTKQWQPELSYGPLQSLKNDNPTAQQVCQAVVKIRQSKLPDPHVLANAGSFFKNPIVSHKHAVKLKQSFADIPVYAVDQQQQKLAAGWLIEQTGLKGYRVGDISVYQKQALVLVNHGNGCAEDLLAVIKHIQGQVWRQFAVCLEHEVRLIGRHNEIHIQGAVSE